MSTVENGNKGPSGIWPVSVAVGIAVLLVGLVVDLLLVAVGSAIVVCAAVLWAREARSGRGRQAAAAAPLVERRAALQAERFPRSGLLARATMGLGALVGLGVALPATGAAILSSLGGRRQRPVDLGPVNAFPEGQYVIATFLTDPEASEVSRRAAYVRNNGLVGDVPSFTILSSRCTHVGCPTQPNGPTPAAPAGADEHRRGRARSDAAGGVRLSLPRQPVRHRGQPDGRPCAAGTRPLPILDPATAAWCSARATASTTSAVPVRQPGSSPSP